MSRLNYHHLYYFWRVAKQGNLTKTATALHISQSALSTQIRQLESSMGVDLFIREGRQLKLTESGFSALGYAEEIFKRGEELESLLSKGIQPELLTVRIGFLTTMSRNFIEGFIEPLIDKPNTKYMLHARGQVNLLNALANHEFDFYSVQYTLVPADPLMDISWLVSGGDNYVGYVNDTVDQALASVGSLKTNDELKAAFSLVNQAMQQDVPMINVYVSEPLGAVSNRLVNAEPHAYGSFNHVDQWDIAQ